jgi:hypothetical protein
MERKEKILFQQEIRRVIVMVERRDKVLKYWKVWMIDTGYSRRGGMNCAVQFSFGGLHKVSTVTVSLQLQ